VQPRNIIVPILGHAGLEVKPTAHVVVPAGLREHRVVVDPRAFGPQPPTGGWPGIGNLISVVVEGRIGHEGSLGHRLARTACQKPL